MSWGKKFNSKHYNQGSTLSDSLISKVQNYGFEVDNLNLDGQVHRFKTSNKPKKKNGWYVGKTLTLRGDRTLEIVTVGDWALGETQTFTSRDDLSETDRKMFSAASKKMQKELDELQEKNRDAAAKEAKLIWADGVLVEKGFEYLLNKGIETFKAVDFVKMTKDKNALVVPVFNLSGEIRSCQIVGRDGKKKYLTGGEIKGNFLPLKGDGDLCVICEGFATGATIFSALDGQVSVIIAFQGNNLFPVTTQMVLEYGAERVFIAADDDRYNGHNAGLFYSDKCKELGVKVIVPNFESVGYYSKPTDFNDLHSLRCLEVVTNQLESVLFQKKIENLIEVITPTPELPSPMVETGSELWPSKEIGFYVMVPQKNGELKAVPRFVELAKYFRHALRVRFSDAMVLIWEETHYKTIDKTELLGFIYRLTLDRCQPDHLEKFLKIIRAECDSSQVELLPTDDLVNLKNGVLNIKTRVISIHDPNYDFRYCLPFEYDPHATCPNWEKFLSEVFMSDDDLVELSSEIFGYTLLGGKPFLHKCFMLYGIGRNGKSVFLDVLRAIIGDANCASKSIESLHEKFSRSALVGKLANVSQETSKREIESGIFKSIVAGDRIDASFKGKDEFEFTPTCRMFFAGNFFPTFKDSSAGMNDRLVIIPFNRYFTDDERDSGVLGRILDELSGVFNWSLLGLARLLERGRLPKVKSVDELRDEYQTASCSAYGFMTSACEFGESFDWRKLSEFYAPYEEYCLGQRVQPKSKISFSITLTGYLLKAFGNLAIKKDRDKFNMTNRLVLKGELRVVSSPENARIVADSSTKRVVKNWALDIESKENFDMPPNTIM